MQEKIKELLTNAYSENNQLQGLMIDGALDYSKWSDQKLKVLFYYKETYGYHDFGVTSISDYYERWIENNRTYKKTALMASILMRYAETKEFDEYNQKDFKKMYRNKKLLKDTISRVAFVNVNKTSNKSNNTNDKAIRQKSMQYSEMLKKQLEVLNPDIIICGGRVTADSLFRDLDYLSKKNYSLGSPEIVDKKIIVPVHHLATPSFGYAKIHNVCKEITELM